MEAEKEEMLALPCPSGEEATNLGPSGSASLDNLGPIVINEDGTTSRITNWQNMTKEEQNRVMRIIPKRNEQRRAKLLAAGKEVQINSSA